MSERPPVSVPDAGGRVTLRRDVGVFAGLTGWGYFPVAFAGRLPFAMMIVGLLTLIASVRGSVAEAGLVAAFAGVGTAACGPGIGSLADRVGQRRVLLIVSGVSVLAGGGLLAAVAAGAPVWVLVPIAVVLGGTTPQVAPFSRARLVGVAAQARTPERRARATSLVMSYESIADESSFVLGPVLVGLLTALIHPAAPLVVSMALTLTVVVGFALHRTGAAVVPHAHDARIASGLAAASASAHESTVALLLRPRILILVVAMLLVGGVFGSTLTALTEFMRERGAVGASGIVYGAMSAGAIVVALIVAALPARFALPARWLLFAVIGLAGAGVMVLSGSARAGSVGAIVAGLALAGCGIGAVLVTLFSLGAAEAPAGRTTTVLTALQSTLVVGQALVTAACGALVEVTDAAAGFAVTAGLAAGLIALAAIRVRGFSAR
ncbi:MAG TPA: MFS transporter [Pseudolysinimonas sp.]|jgi:MFS family permease|nr:MFS transporter [Pseudolysinimonas sp.]